jgi:hypothetical protein
MPKKSTIRMRSYVISVMVCGLAVIAFTASQLAGVSYAHLAGLVCAAALASRLSLKIPRLTASLSLDVPFVILAAVQMGLAAAVVVAAVATVIQCVKPGLDKSGFMKLCFNVSVLSMAAALAAVAVQFSSLAGVRFAVAGLALLAANSLLVAFVVSLEGNGSAAKILSQLLSWSFPAYVLGAGMACMMVYSQPIMGWYVPLLALPVMVLVYQSYRKYFGVSLPSPDGSVEVTAEPEMETVNA